MEKAIATSLLFARHQSLVTPIDWKLSECDMALGLGLVGHHSLVTPIDWKLNRQPGLITPTDVNVTTRW